MARSHRQRQYPVHQPQPGYDGLGICLELGVLAPQPALELPTRRRQPRAAQEAQDARDLAEDLGQPWPWT